jgi:predicted enzyme related to lactoylglutathione lyase
VDRALQFYRDQLGLALVHSDGSFHEFDTGGARLAIDAGGVAVPGPKGADRCPVEIHLRVTDIQATRAKLEAQGILFGGETLAFAYGQFARFFDPDGTPLLLFQPGECPLKAGAQGVLV